MSRKVSSILLALILCTFNLTAQDLRITILDDALGSPVEDAFVMAHQLGNNDTISAITNRNGYVILKGLSGELELFISHLSFVPFSDTISANKAQTLKLTPLSFQMEETVITGQYKPEDAKSSLYSVKIIDQKTIESQAANNLQDLLSQTLNVRITQDNILGSGMSLQGLGGEQVKYMVDGVPIIGRVNGDIDLSQLNLNDVERIEIIEGPASVLYGTNALGGVVNIITKKEQEQKINTSVKGYYESVGQYNIDAMASFTKKRHFFSLSGGRYFFDGFDTNNDRDQLWNPKTQYFGTIKYGYATKKGLRFLLSSNLFSEKITNLGNPSNVGTTIRAFDDYYKTLRSTSSLTISGPIFKNHYVNQVFSYAYYERTKNTYRKDLVTLSEVLVPDASMHDTSRFQAYMARGFISRSENIKKFDYQIGYDVNIEEGTGKKIEAGSRWIGDFAGFISGRYRPIQRLSIQPGIRWSYNTAYKAPVTPSLHMKFDVSENIILRLSYARGFRAPSIKELYFDFNDINHFIYGNEDLKAEHSNNVNAQLAYNRSFKHLQIVKLSATYFFNDIQNDIELLPDYRTNANSNNTQPYTYANFARNLIMGGMLNASYQRGNTASVNIGFSAIGRRFIFNDTLNSGGFIFSPELSISASYLIPKALIRVSVFNKYNGELQTPYMSDEGGVGKQTIKAYNLLDITLSRSFWKNRITLSAGVKNLTDVVNVQTVGNSGAAHSVSSGSTSIGWGRSYFASLRFNFNIK